MLSEELKKELEREAERIKEDSLYTFKAQYEDASIWRFCHNLLTLLATVSAVVAGCSAIKDFQSGRIIVIVASFLSALILAILSAVKPLDKAITYHKAGVLFQALRDDARIFKNITISREDITNEEATEILQGLSNRLSELRDKSPQPSQIARRRAKKGIEEGQADYEVDEKKENIN